MPLAADLEAGFGSDGFDLSASLTGLGDLFGGVALPTLSLDTSGSVDLGGLTTDGVLVSIGDLGSVLGGALDGFPDVAQLLAPLETALALLDLVGSTDLSALEAELGAALRPPGAGLDGLVGATSAIGSLPGVGALADGLAALGLDVRAPGAYLGGAAGGLVSLVQLLGALMGVEAVSAEIERRIALATDLLAADRLAALAARVRGAGGASLAGLIGGVDPDDPGLVEIVAAPVEAYAGLVRELVDAATRGVAFAEATVVHADLDALSAELAVATAGLQESALAPVRELVASAAPVIDLVVSLEIPAVGPDALTDASATLATQLQTLIDGVAPTSFAGLIDPVLDPVLAPVRAVNDVVAEIVAALDAAFQPIRDALAAIDLGPVADALESVTAPVQDAVDAIASLLAASQGEVQAVVDEVVALLLPVQVALTEARDAIAAPFAQVHGALAALDLQALQATLEETIGSVASAVSSAPIRPVFDVAADVLTTAADALSLVPRSILPDDVKAELDAACATVEAIDLEPTRTLLHEELAEILAAVDAGALEAVEAGYAAVQEFIAGIDPEPLALELDAGSFAVLRDGLAALDPEALLAEPLAALDEVRGALDGIDLATLVAPVEEALDEVAATIGSLDPAELVAPVEEVLAGVRTTVAETLGLDGWAAQLAAVEDAVAAFVGRFDPTAPLADLQLRWSTLLAPLREQGPSVGASLLGGLLGGAAGLAPGGGLPEVLSWIRGERVGAEVVRGRLTSAATLSADAATVLAAVDLRSVAAEITAAYAALTAAVEALPADSSLRSRLAGTLAATDPRAEIASMPANVDRALGRFRAAETAIAATTPPDRSEVSLVAAGLAAAFAPWSPVLATGRRLLAVVGIDETPLPLGAALADALESIGPEPIVAPFAAVVQSALGRVTELVADGIVAPLAAGVDELRTLLDSLSVETLLGGVEGIRTDLLGLVDEIRPTTVLAAPIATFESLKATLATLDPLGPVRIAVDTLRATVDVFAAEFAPSVLLQPVIVVYDDVAALVGAFDVAGLLEPVLTALHDIGRSLDEGMDEVIDALEELQAACAGEGGPVPGLGAAVSVGGSLGL